MTFFFIKKSIIEFGIFFIIIGKVKQSYIVEENRDEFYRILKKEPGFSTCI